MVVPASVVVRNRGIVRLIAVGDRENKCNIFSNTFYVRELAYTLLLSFSLDAVSELSGS